MSPNAQAGSRYPQIETLLRNSVGLNPNAIPGAITRAVDRLMHQQQVRHPQDFCDRLKSSGEDFHVLLEMLLVPETWFFRYPESFQFFKRWAHQKFASKPVRILSIGCSTGEEPYSIAMSLLDAGIPAGHFRIHAADISSVSITKAVHGLYSRNAFRASDMTFRQKYFEQQNQIFLLKPEVRKMVKFVVWNALQPAPPELSRSYDVIFCRNLLIYLHESAQKHFIGTLNQMVVEEGLLFSGHAEAGALLAPTFQIQTPWKAFVHMKK